jgi:heme A synthase
MLDFVLALHYYNVFLVLTAATIVGVWGLVLYFTKRAMVKLWRYLLWLTAILGALQGVLGLTMVAMGQKPGTGTGLYYLHYVYGGIVALVIPIVAMTYTTGGKNLRRDLLILSIAALVLAAAGVRAWMTGPAVP